MKTALEFGTNLINICWSGIGRQGSVRLDQDTQLYERLKDNWLAPITDSQVPPALLEAARALEAKLVEKHNPERAVIRLPPIAPARLQMQD